MSTSELSLPQKKLYGNNHLWCNKTIISGKKYYQVFTSLLLFSLPFSILFAISIKISQPKIVIIIITILYIIPLFSAIRGGFTDPGILTRQNEDYFYNTNRPILRYVINGHIINLNYCYTCCLYRPPRTSHCALCDNCVERFDHHCIWLGTCVGKRNYKFFYLLISSLNFNALIHVSYSIYLIVFQCKNHNKKDKYNSLVISTMSFVIAFDTLFVVFFIGKLFILHTYLIFKNLTFYENIKKKWNKPPGLNLLYKSTCYVWFRYIYKLNPLSSLSIFYKNNNNYKSNINKSFSDNKISENLDFNSNSEEDGVSDNRLKRDNDISNFSGRREIIALNDNQKKNNEKSKNTSSSQNNS